MSTDDQHLTEANTCHDAEPARAAGLLRQIDMGRLAPERQPLLAYLFNHVLGEKLSAWDEALANQRQLIALALPAPPLVMWRQLGAAAQVVDAQDALAQATEGLVAASGAAAVRAQELLLLAAAMYLAPSQPGPAAGQTALQALAPVTDTAWPTGTPLDAQAAACVNNIASGLLERSHADLRNGAVRAALARSADQAHRLWLHAGTWVQLERALYGRAMAGTALGEPHMARRHALAGLAVLDENDGAHGEDVDRAFFELERWNACAWLGLVDEAGDALKRAEALAAQFNDAGLTDWFEDRRKRLPDFRH